MVLFADTSFEGSTSYTESPKKKKKLKKGVSYLEQE